MSTTYTKKNVADLTRAEWLEERRTGIGGSDAAAVLGLNPWRSPLAVYMDKTAGRGDVAEDDMPEALWWGTEQESLVAKRFSQLTGEKVINDQSMYRSAEYPWALANIDRRVVGKHVGLECKTTEVYNKTDFDDDEIPPTYYWQCQHYMAVLGWQSWYLAVKVGNGKAFHIFMISRDEAAIARLMAAEKELWRRIQAHEPPLPTGSEADCELVRELTGTARAADDEPMDLRAMDDDLTMLAMLKRQSKDTDTKIKAIEQRVKLAMGDMPRAESTSYTINYRNQEKSSLDSKRLLAEHPEMDAYKKTTSYRVLTIKENKKNG